MGKLPKYVQEILKELKLRYKHHLEARLVGNTYYVSEATTRWDKERKKVINVKKYLGRIKPNQLFIEGKHRVQSNASTVNESLQEAPITPEKNDMLILKGLSMNSRITLGHLKKLINAPQSTLYSRIKRLEESYKRRDNQKSYNHFDAESTIQYSDYSWHKG